MSTFENKSKRELIEEIESLKKQVDELKKNEDILKSSEEKFIKTFNSSPSPMIISEIETGKIVDVNIAFSKMLMYTKQELIGKSVLKLNLWVNPKDRNIYVKKMMDENKISNHEIELRTKSGDIRTTLISGEIIGIKGKNYLFTSSTDITERKHAGEALKESEEKFRKMFNESPIGIELYEADGMQLTANKSSLKMFGIPDESEINGFNIFDGNSLDVEKKEKLRRGETVEYQSAFDFEKVKELQQYKTDRIGIAYFDYIITP